MSELQSGKVITGIKYVQNHGPLAVSACINCQQGKKYFSGRFEISSSRSSIVDKT
jgi:hypothetical protein